MFNYRSDDIKSICDECLRSLLKSGALEVVSDKKKNDVVNGDVSRVTEGSIHVYNTSELAVSKLGRAAIKGI